MVVYIDVLFVLNLIVNYFLLLAESQLLHRQDRRLRIFAASLLGALYACLIFFPQLSFLYTALLKLAFSITIVAVAFKCHGIISLLKLLAFFYITGMLFGGIIYAVTYFLAPPSLLIKNGIAYVDISPICLILSGAGCYIVIRLFSKRFHKSVHTRDLYRVTIHLGNQSVTGTALLDNGNDLRDAISSVPVVVAEYHCVEKLIPPALRFVFKSGSIADSGVLAQNGFDKRFRVVPYGSLGGTGGLLPAFRPDHLFIEKAEIDTADVLIAVTGNRLSGEGLFSMLLNPILFASAQQTQPQSKPKRQLNL
jgi:stage II sporulation protein GA (sporulation sigma-E factor processing peptidase)